MLKHILPLLLPALLFSGCIRMEVPEGFDLSGRWALVDGSGKCSKVLEFSDGREIEYMSGTAYWYQEESLWHCSEDDFTKYYHEYGILDGILYVDGVKQSGISLNKGTLKIGESEYRNVNLDSDYYSTVSVETDHVLCGTTACRIEVPYTISRPIKGLLMDIASACDWLTVEEPGADKVVISVLDNNTGNSRNGSILLQYDSAADVRVDVTQSYSAPEIVCNPVSLECSYLAQQCSFEYTVSDSRADAELVAATSDSWISGLNVEDGKVSFNVVENNSSFQRSGTIKLSYILSGTVLATANYSVEQTYSSASVKVSPESTTAAYTGGSFSIDCTIDNPRNGATLTATTATSWISGIKVEDGKMSFNVAENNSGAQRSGTIKMSYGVSGTTYATKDYAVVQNGMPVTSLTLNKTSLEMNVGTSETLVATVTPSDATLVWSSSNTSVATVDGNCKVTAKANGTTTITVKSAYGTETATCAVTVTTAVTGVSLNKTTLSLKIGSSETLVATVAPSTASNKDVIWSSSNASVATVDGNGKIIANAKGSATITVMTVDGSKTATCVVTVTTIPVTGVSLNKTTLSLNIGSSETLVTTVSPSTATNKDVIWLSSNTSVATAVNGKVTAKANGTATITAKTADGSKTATCAVTVTTPVTGVTLNKTTLSLNVGSSETLVATIAPSTASNKEVTWSSSNTSVATVDGNGKVTAKANGTATITVKTADGSKTATCAVAVTIPVTGVSLNKTILSLNVGSSETLVATIAPSTAFNKEVTWSSSNTSVATVDGNGKVAATAKGSATITVKTTDGARTATCAVNVRNPCPAGAVDLGLSVYWATCNLGASTPEGYGDYYAWGATEPWYKDGYAQSSNPQWKSGKSGGYSWANCPFNGGYFDFSSSYWSSHKSECVDSNNVLRPANDAAHVNLGGNWRMPTIEEWDELLNSCSWTWTSVNGINGYKVQSKKSGYTDKWIFLPAAGDWDDWDLGGVGVSGLYWSSSLLRYSDDAFYLLFISSYKYTDCIDRYRYFGQSVRPVAE